MSVLNNSAVIGLLGAPPPAAAGGISRSLRFNSSDSAYCSRVPASAGNRKTWTWAGWVKRSALGAQYDFASAGDSGDYVRIGGFDSSDRLGVRTDSAVVSLVTTQVFRDCSAWYHFVIAFDTTHATAANRVKLYVNGQQITVFTTATYPNQNTDWAVNNTGEHRIGAFRDKTDPTVYFPFAGYLADIHFIDGQALDPTSFGEFDATTGVWVPKAYTGSYGTNGFRLEFADNSSNTATTLGKDTSGNGNNWTPNNLSVTAGAGNDSLVDVPTNGAQTDTGVGGEVRGNYCTWNPVGSGSGATLTNGNLDYSLSGATGSARQSRGTFLIPTSGKWYWEHTVTTVGESNLGVIDFQTGVSSVYYHYDVGGFQNIYINDVQTAAVAGYTNNDVISVAYDSDNQQIRFYKNGSQVGTNYSLTNTGRFVPYALHGSGSGSCAGSTNFGARPFAYTAPSGFKALNTANLPAPLVTKPNTVFDVKLYTGNGSTQTISGLNMSPDLVWIKNRSEGFSNILTDTVRGATNKLISDRTDAENTTDADQIYGTLEAFTSDGFTVNVGTFAGTAGGQLNKTSIPYVAWAWDAGSSTVTNTAGSITGTVSVRANATAGFSIVTYTGNGVAGATVGHGLGVAPSMIIIKNRDASDAWQVYHAANTANPETDYLVLNTTAATADALDRWNDTAPTSTVFSIGDGVEVNTNTEDYVAYCFAPVVGYSSFGSYTGNGSTDGPFVYTGFRPRWVMWKRTDSSTGGAWVMLDAARNTYNIVNLELYANSSMAEGTFSFCDFLSNGFKLRTSDVFGNASGGTYVFAAFAESPFSYARAR